MFPPCQVILPTHIDFDKFQVSVQALSPGCGSSGLLLLGRMAAVVVVVEVGLNHHFVV